MPFITTESDARYELGAESRFTCYGCETRCHGTPRYGADCKPYGECCASDYVSAVLEQAGADHDAMVARMERDAAAPICPDCGGGAEWGTWPTGDEGWVHACSTVAIAEAAE